MKINWKDLIISAILFWIIFVVIFWIISPAPDESHSVVAWLLFLSYTAAMLYYFDKYPECWSSLKENLFNSLLMGIIVALPLFLLVLISNPTNILSESSISTYIIFILGAGWGLVLALIRNGMHLILREPKKGKKK